MFDQAAMESQPTDCSRQSAAGVREVAGEAKLRVLVVTTSYPLTAGSASGVFVQRLVQHLPPSVDPTVLTPSPCRPTSLPDGRVRCFRYSPRRWQVLAHRPGGIPVALQRAKFSAGLVPGFLMAMFLAVLRDARRVGVVHANWAIVGVVAAAACAIARRPLLTTLRGEDVNRGLRGGPHRILLELCLRFSDRVTVVSEAHLALLRERYPWLGERLSFVPNGVDSALLDMSSKPRTAAEPLRVLSVGSLIARKDHATLLEALALAGVATRLTLVGEGPERAALEAQIRRLGLAHQVELVGALEPEAIPEQLAAADVFVLPSRSEGRPNVLLEAMAAGLPCVASDIDGVRELLGGGSRGLCFTAGDSGALAFAVRRLAQQPVLRRQLGRSARAFIVGSGLDWRATGRAYGRLYRDIVPEISARGRSGR